MVKLQGKARNFTSHTPHGRTASHPPFLPESFHLGISMSACDRGDEEKGDEGKDRWGA
jgi:hypothetical protein